MKLRFSDRRKTPSEAAGASIDLDVTPIMNLMIVLIPLLVSMTVFAHYSIHDFYLPSNVSETTPSDSEITFNATVVITRDSLYITLGSQKLESLLFDGLTLDTAAVTRALDRARKRSDIPERVIVSAADAAEFDRIVSVMDICRSAGFENIGLSSFQPGE
jgi:biopolymer transport protein ExbD